MNRRTFLCGLTLAFLGVRFAVEAQGKIPRVGVLSPGIASTWTPGGPFAHLLRELRKGLEEFGYVEGQNVAIDLRFAEGNVDRISDLVAELVGLPVDVLLAIGPVVLRTARSATATVPIVAVDFETDPVVARFAASLARPGGNITGTFLDQPELGGKWLNFLKEAVPRLSRVAGLWDAATPSDQLHALEVAARTLALKLQTLEVRGINDFEGAFAAGAKHRAQAVVILSSPLMARSGARLADFAAARQLPTISMFRENAAAGCLMAYGPTLADAFRRLGLFAGKILKGAKPGDLPIERPTRFEFVINLKTARALGLTIPQSLLLRADEVIE